MQARTELTPQQEQAIAALLAYPTKRDAARSLSMSERTLGSWLALPHFQAALEQARSEMMQEAMNYVKSQAVTSLKTIVQIRDNKKTHAAIRLKAALSLAGCLLATKSEDAPGQAETSSADVSLAAYLTPDELAELDTLIAKANARKQAGTTEVKS